MCADVLRFGAFELDPENFQLRREGRRVKLDRMPLQLLILLASQPGKLISHRSAVDQVWGKEVFIEAESALYTAVRKIRRALEDNSGEPKFVETVSRKGYRFIAPVKAPSEPTRAAKQEGRRAVLAVLPLENLSGDPRQEYFSDGLTEELITALGRLSAELGVIARTSVLRYKKTRKSIAEIAQELGADYVIEGSARRERARVRIALQLIRAADQTHVWAQAYEYPLRDVLRIQEEVAEAAARIIRLKLAKHPPATAEVDPHVYDCYLRARYLWDQRTSRSIEAAIVSFQKALQADSKYAPAWAGLANCLSALPLTSDVRPRDCFPQAQEAALQAQTLDPFLPEAHIAGGLVHFWFDWDATAAEESFRRAIELNPSNSSARMFLAHLHSNMQRHGEAIREIQQARNIDPLSRIVNTHEGHFLYNEGRYPEAKVVLGRVLKLAPKFWIPHLMLGKVLGITQRFRESLAEFTKADRYSYGNTEPSAFRGYTLAASGRAADARRLVRALERRGSRHYVPAPHRALIWVGLSEHAAALESLERALEEKDVRLIFLGVESRWDPLRAHPQFKKIYKRIGMGDRPRDSQPY